MKKPAKQDSLKCTPRLRQPSSATGSMSLTSSTESAERRSDETEKGDLEQESDPEGWRKRTLHGTSRTPGAKPLGFKPPDFEHAQARLRTLRKLKHGLDLRTQARHDGNPPTHRSSVFFCYGQNTGTGNQAAELQRAIPEHSAAQSDPQNAKAQAPSRPNSYVD